jgi:serine protease AprX
MSRSAEFGRPYRVKGVGEVNIVPPMAAIANAIDSALHRLTELPMSPPKIRTGSMPGRRTTKGSAKFLGMKRVRHCERSEAISSTADRPGVRLPRPPGTPALGGRPSGGPRNDRLLFSPSDFASGLHRGLKGWPRGFSSRPGSAAVTPAACVNSRSRPKTCAASSRPWTALPRPRRITGLVGDRVPRQANGRTEVPKAPSGSQPRRNRNPRASKAKSAARFLRNSTLSEAFKDPNERERVNFPIKDNEPGPIVIELNLLFQEGLEECKKHFQDLLKQIVRNSNRNQPDEISNTYYSCALSMVEVKALLAADEKKFGTDNRTIYRVWPDFPVGPLIDRSVSTVKGDAARRSYDATGSEVAWAVIDSGIDATHPHFSDFDNLGGEVSKLHRDFTLPRDGDVAASIQSALIDESGHGTHVAGIIAGQFPIKNGKAYVGQHTVSANDVERKRRQVNDFSRLQGVAPRCKLVSLKVLGGGANRSTLVIRALQYIRETVNGNGKLLRVQGVNLSLGYEFNARWFACGQSPICVEVDRLVRSGVVVVIAAGNTGYGDLNTAQGVTSTCLTLTINDPGNAELAITVGATHRDSPHTYGVSYFSSKGPTCDGRLKPDLVAPRERITSSAAGRLRKQLEAAFRDDPLSSGAAAYADDSGTSMAAPHVSGCIAAFLSIRREYIGRPEEVKRIFLENATSLGRERYFEGHGLVDLMRSIQAV